MPESPSTVPNRPSGLSGFLTHPWTYPLLACFLLVALLSIRQIGSTDLGFHLKAGQWILQHLSVPQKDVFTYTQKDRDYTDVSSLFQVLIYGLYQFFGYSALTLFNAGVLLLIFAFLALRLRATQAPPWLRCLLLLAAVLGMERRFIVRPEVFSWFYLGLTLWVLDQRFTQKRNLLFLLPLIQWLWVNTEGLFILGWAVQGAYLFSGWIQKKRLDPFLMRFSLLSVVVGFLNPYGLHGLLFPFALWNKLKDSSLYKNTIAELLSPWQDLKMQNLGLDPHLNLFLFFAAVPVVLLFLALTFRQRKIHEFLLVLAFLYLALKAQRNIPLFLIVSLPVLSASMMDLKIFKNQGRQTKPLLGWGLAFLILLWCLRVMTDAYYIGDRRNDRFGLGLDSQVLPVKAAQFLVQNRLEGRMLNDLDSGDWLDFLAPQPTFIDGRLDLLEDSFYRQFLQSYSPGGLIPLLSTADAQLVVVEYNTFTPWVDQLNRFSNWRLIYLDESTAIYARSDYAPQIPTLFFPALFSSLGIPSVNPQAARLQLKDLKLSPMATWLRGFYQPQTYAMGDFSMGLFALRARDYSAARDVLMEGFRRTTGSYPEVFFNLALVNLGSGDPQLAQLCLEYTLQLDPGNKRASEMLGHFNPM